MTPRNGRSRSKSGLGGRRLVLFSLASLAILSLTFTLGIFVGRQWNRSAPAPVQAEKGKKPVLAGRGGLRDSQAERTGQIREKLTFYQDLPAPLGSPPPSVSKPGSASAEPAKRAAKSADLPKGPPKPDETAGSERTFVPEPQTPQLIAAQSQTSGPSRQMWTVQVAAYRTPEPAHELRRSLGSAGYDAHVMTASTDDGKALYRVRVGSFLNRSEAEKAAQRLKAERSLSTFVTTRSAEGQ